MDSSIDPHTKARFEYIFRILSASAVLIGLLVLTGWALNNQALISLIPGLQGMKANTAFAFILCGLSALLKSCGNARWRHAGDLLAVIVILLGLATLMEYILALDAGIDQILVKDAAAEWIGYPPGRMVPIAAMSFVALGLSLILVDYRTRASQLLALTVGLLGLLEVVTFSFYDVHVAYGFLSYTQMPLTAAFCFTVLGAGMLVGRSDRGLMAAYASNGPGGLTMRRLFFPLSAFLVVLGWMEVQGEKAGIYEPAFGHAYVVMAFMTVLIGVLWWNATSLDRVETNRRAAHDHTLHLKGVLEALRNVNQLIVREDDTKRLMEQSCEMLLQARGYRMIWIGLADAYKKITPFAMAGAGAGFLKGLQISCDIEDGIQCSFCRAVRAMKPDICADVALDRCLWRGAAVAMGLRSSVAVPMVLQDRVFGVLNVYSDRPGAFDDEEVALLDELAGDLAYALQSMEALAQRKIAQEALQARESRYRYLVENAPLGVISVDSSGRITEFNPKVLELIGSPSSEFTRSVNVLTFPLLVQSEVSEDFRRCLDTGEVVVNERRYISQWQKDAIMRYHLAPIRDLDGKIAGVQGIIEDITESRRAQEALRDSESKLAVIIEFLPDATMVVDIDGKVVAWNRAIEEMTGVGRTRMIGQGDHAYTVPFYGEKRKNLLDLISTPDEDLASKYQNVEKRGSILYAETFTPALNAGKGAYVWAIAAPIFDDQGRHIGAIESIRDITERKKAELSLQEQLNFLQQLIDVIPSPIFYKDVSGLYKGCNRAFETLTGFKKAEITGRTAHELYPGDLADKYEEADEMLFASPGVQVYEDSAFEKGTRHDIIFNKATYVDTAGRLAGLVGIMLDITERKQMENALRESERRLGYIIDFLPDPTLVIDGDGKVIAWNRAMEALTGVNAVEMLGKGNYEHSLPFYGQRRPILIDLVLRPQDDAETGYSNLKRDGGSLVGEAYMPMLGGGEVYLWGVASALYDSNGNIVGAIESIKDISERKRYEEMLESSLQEKEVLLKEIHHRVKNNLQIVSSLLRLQSRRIQDKETADAFRDSQNRIKSMALVHEKLYRSEDLSRVHLSEYIMKLTRDLIESFQSGKTVRFYPDLQEVFLGIDKAIPFGLILNELITNCLKHAFPSGRRGEIHVDLKSDGRSLTLKIRDNGIGMPDGLDLANPHSMGLTLVQSLVKQLKGRLEIRNGEGTEFEVSIDLN